MRITINVTARDIDKGSRCSPDCCPVARALKRKFPKGTQIVVSGRTCKILDTWYIVPESISRFIKVFDDTGNVLPFKEIVDLEEVKNVPY